MHTKTKLTMARDAARELLRIHHPELNVNSVTKNAVLIAHARQILGDALVTDDPDTIMKQLIDHLRSTEISTSRLTKPRVYAYDKAMQAAIERIGDYPNRISILSRAHNNERF